MQVGFSALFMPARARAATAEGLASISTLPR